MGAAEALGGFQQNVFGGAVGIGENVGIPKSDDAPTVVLEIRRSLSVDRRAGEMLTAIELYAEVFEQENALDRLEAFASFHGPDFYRLPRNTDSITLVREPWVVPAELGSGASALVPLRAGTEVAWRLAD